MPLIPDPDLASVPVAERQAFDAMPSNIWRAMLHAPPLFAGAQSLGRTIMTTGKLPADLRELVILATQRVEGGNYGWALHVPIALQCGCTKEQIAAIEAVRFDDPAFNTRQKAAIALSREVAQQVRASEASVENAKKHLSSAEIVEIVIITGYYGMISRFSETLRIETDAPGGESTVFQRVPARSV